MAPTLYKAPTMAELTTMKVTGKNSPTFGCETDADCYVAYPDSAFATAATTDAQKAKICCVNIGDIKMPAGLMT